MSLGSKNNKQARPKKPETGGKPKNRKEKVCQRCGNRLHKYAECPARDVECHVCEKIGHFGKMCKTGNSHVKQVEAHSDYDDDESFLGTVYASQVSDSNWDIALNVDKTPVSFKIDTGADVTVIGHSDYKKIAKDTILQKADQVLVGANNKPLKTIGMFQPEIANGNKDISKQKVYVVDKLRKPLLGKPAIMALSILKRTNEITSDPPPSTSPPDYSSEFPKPTNTQTYSDTRPRRISQPLLPKVKETMDKMLTHDVIRKYCGHKINVCAPIVVVPKSVSKKVRICTDLTDLNRYVIRPRSRMNNDETLGKIKMKQDYPYPYLALLTCR